MDNQCVFSDPSPNCCSRDQDCKDDNPCTMDICLSGACVYPQDSLNLLCGCESNFDCNDNNACTLDSCLGGKCVYDKALSGDCCGDSSQCDDEDPTTDDFCKMYTCIHKKRKTCIDDSTCADESACTTDKCLEGVCVHEHTDDPYCCNYNTDCDDGNPCTAGACILNACKYQILEQPGCCKSALECDDGIGCTIDECKDWGCAHTPVGAKCCTPDTAEIVCDDGNPCTIDICQNGLCEWQMITTGCCEESLDCSDCINVVTGASCQVDLTTDPPSCKGGSDCVLNVCTNQSCSNEFCYYTALKGCCLVHGDCNDGNACTDDVCTPDHKCKNSLTPGCCASNGMCNDGKICTIDICDIAPGQEKGTCKFQEKEDCCTTPDDCEPKTCKLTYCQNGNCIYQPMEDCCVHDEECDDGDVCTIDKCDNKVCKHIPSGLCGD